MLATTQIKIQMKLIHALRLNSPAVFGQTISLVGAGGKTTALFQVARELLSEKKLGLQKVIISSTTHFGAWQTPLADRHIRANDARSLAASFNNELRGVILVTGETKEDRTQALNAESLVWLQEHAKNTNTPLLLEADGSRTHSLKAPAAHEPAIPNFSDVVIVVAGLSTIGTQLNDEHVHRAEIFSELTQTPLQQTITPDSILQLLLHPQGGLKNIPLAARKIVILNQADTASLQSTGGDMAKKLIDHFDSVLVTSLQNKTYQTFEHTAGILLAAGEATRFGAPKQLLDWHGKPFVRHIAETALRAGLWPVVVVTGFHATDVESVLTDLPVSIAYNAEYQQGQSASIRKGVSALPQHTGAAVFLLADQPQISIEVIRALDELHTQELAPIIAPLVLEERRANPVLFDQVTFPDLLQLEGDVGGRAIFSKFKVEYIPWHDDRLLFDVDKPEDYQRLVEDETL